MCAGEPGVEVEGEGEEGDAVVGVGEFLEPDGVGGVVGGGVGDGVVFWGIEPVEEPILSAAEAD